VDVTQTNRRIAKQFNEAFNRGDLDAAARALGAACLRFSGCGFFLPLLTLDTNRPRDT